MTIVDIDDRPVERESGERARVEWHGSADGIMWCEWRFLCWLDEDVYRKQISSLDVWEFNFIQVRIVAPPRPPLVSPVFTWDELDDPSC